MYIVISCKKILFFVFILYLKKNIVVQINITKNKTKQNERAFCFYYNIKMVYLIY